MPPKWGKGRSTQVIHIVCTAGLLPMIQYQVGVRKRILCLFAFIGVELEIAFHYVVLLSPFLSGYTRTSGRVP
jgi:hypothetical protein